MTDEKFSDWQLSERHPDLPGVKGATDFVFQQQFQLERARTFPLVACSETHIAEAWSTILIRLSMMHVLIREQLLVSYKHVN